MDFAEFIQRVDHKGALFYLNPPYWGCEGDYGKALFSRDRFEEMAALLARLKGRFILSLNNVPEVREIFGRFTIEEKTTTYTIAGKGGAAGTAGGADQGWGELALTPLRVMPNSVAQ